MRKRTFALLFVSGGLTLILVFVTLSPAPIRPIPPTSEETRVLFDELVRDEPAGRRKAKEEWAHHRWSQQDAFGAIELDKVNAVAGSKGRSRQDLFLVIDEGLRAKWPGPDGGMLEATVVPLKPRPLD